MSPTESHSPPPRPSSWWPWSNLTILLQQVAQDLIARTRLILESLGRLEASLTRLEKLMSRLSDQIQALSSQAASMATAAEGAIGRAQSDLARLQTTADNLTAQVATLQAQVDAGGASQADIDALAALQGKLADVQTKLDSLDPTNPQTLP